MSHFEIALGHETMDALISLKMGVVEVAISGRMMANGRSYGASICTLELADGRFVELSATQVDLNFKWFEVFPLQAVFTTQPRIEERKAIEFGTSIKVSILKTEEWLEPSSVAEADGLMGNSEGAMTQFSSRPGMVPKTALATCTFCGGVELSGANGKTLIIATLPSPYEIHISEFSGVGEIQRDHYSADAL